MGKYQQKIKIYPDQLHYNDSIKKHHGIIEQAKKASPTKDLNTKAMANYAEAIAQYKEAMIKL